MAQPTPDPLAYLEHVLSQSAASEAQKARIIRYMCAWWGIPPPAGLVTEKPRRGRPPSGGAMTGAERVRKHRALHRP